MKSLPALLAACFAALAAAGLPPAAMAQTPDEDVGLIELWVVPPGGGLWAVAQWGDDAGAWHNIDGWTGPVSGAQIWEVLSPQLGQRRFRWEVYQGYGGALVARSDPFDLPAGDGESVRIILRLLPGPGGPATTEVYRLPKRFEIRSETPAVWTGPVTPDFTVLARFRLPHDQRLHPMPNDHLVTTDAGGEALLQARVEAGEPCKVYVFESTDLLWSPCPRSEYQGNATCNLAGSAVYSDFAKCRDYLLMTPSGDIQVTGSWVSQTYLPDRQLTLVVVLEGTARVRPVIRSANRQVGPNTFEVRASQFMLTAPDDMRQRNRDVGPMREARPLTELPAVIETLGIQDWMDRVRVRAAQDQVPFVTRVADLTDPDLVITSFAVAGRASLGSQGTPELPVRIVVANQGDRPADVFRVSAEYQRTDDPSQWYLLPFQGSEWHLSTEEALAGNSQVELRGTLTFLSDAQGQRVVVRAIADSCAGEEFTPDYCRVKESNEQNNTSKPLSATLPAVVIK